MRRRGRMGQTGQASVELLAAVPALIGAGLVAFQLLAVGYSLHLADGAAEAGGLAVAAGRDPEDAALASLPGWAADRARVEAHAGRVTVTVNPPSPLPVPRGAFAVSADAWAKGPDG